MRFSIIVPVYNVEKYLPYCIESVLAQSFSDYELILVDDGSPDHCPEICDSYANKDNRIKVIHKQNGGLSDARNVGIEVAKGDYLLFLDSDDYWNTAHVLSRVEEILSLNTYDVLQFGLQKFYADHHTPEPCVKQVDLIEKGNDETYLYKAVSQKRLTISAWSMVISRSFLQKKSLYFVKGIKSEDIEWGIRLFAEKPDVLFMKESFYIYRQSREGSITSSVDVKHMEDYCSIIESSISLLSEKQDNALNALMSYVMYHITIATGLCSKVDLTSIQKRKLKRRLKASAKNRLIKYHDDPRVQMVLPFYRLLGFGAMSVVLGFYLRYRGR